MLFEPNPERKETLVPPYFYPLGSIVIAVALTWFRPIGGWQTLLWSKNDRTKYCVLHLLQAAHPNQMTFRGIAARLKRDEAEVALALNRLDTWGYVKPDSYQALPRLPYLTMWAATSGTRITARQFQQALKAKASS